MEKGTKVTFPAEKGYQQYGVMAANLIFVIDEKPHALYYTRDGNNLIMSQDISLLESLTGNILIFLRSEVWILLNQTMSLLSEMKECRFSNFLGKKGNLKIKFDICQVYWEAHN